MSPEAQKFIEDQQMMSEVREHYIAEGMYRAHDLLYQEQKRLNASDLPIPADEEQYHEGQSAGFKNAEIFLRKLVQQNDPY